MAAMIFPACQKNNMASGSADSTAAVSGTPVSANNTAINMEKTRGFYDSVMNAHNVNAVGNYCTADFEDHNPDPGMNGKGMDNLKKELSAWFTSMPDVHFTIDKMSADGNLVWVMYHVSGTMKGDMGPMKATNKSMNVGGMDLIQIKDGKATDRWGYEDQMAMMQQLGMMPPPPGEKKM